MAATLTFSWSKPTSLTSCTDCSFEYKYALSSVSLTGVTPTQYTGPWSGPTFSVTIPGLTNGASYNYAVRTICGPVQSKWSYGTTVVCDTPPIDTPTPTPTAVVQTPTPTPTPTAAPNCAVDIEYATVVSPQKLYWNFATIGEQTWSTVMRFRIQKNGVDYVNTTGSTQNSTQYLAQLQDWMGNTSVTPGDAIIFTVTTETSGSGGSTIGSMATYTTTGTSGYMPNVSGTPVAPNAITLNSQSVDPDGGAVTYSFTVTSGVNYGLNCTYFQ
jgi:hypothetical protein